MEEPLKINEKIWDTVRYGEWGLFLKLPNFNLGKSVLIINKGRVQKKIVEFSNKGGGSTTADFPLRKKNNMGLKHWIFPKNHFKTHLFFFQFLGGGDPFQLRSWSEGWLKLKSSLEKPSDKCPRTHIIQNLFHDA